VNLFLLTAQFAHLLSNSGKGLNDDFGEFYSGVAEPEVRRASMKKKFFTISLLLTILGLMLFSPLMVVFGAEAPPESSCDRTFTFDVQYGYYRFSHKLYTSMPSSLYDYYHGASHIIRGDNYYAKLVTPSVFQSIAENIQNVTDDLPYSEEQFANAVLMLVRQVPYVKSDVKYPVETLLENSGDCDVLSLLAASILKAGGLDVVLLYYKGMSPSHMNIGVYLPYEPIYRTWWLAPAGFEYNNKTYWMAECTSLGDWKVGDRPDLLAGVKPVIIPLENCEAASPAQVASSLTGSLEPSAISIALSSDNASAEESGRTFTVFGSISPAYAGESVVMYVRQEGYSYSTFRTVSTDEFGNYSFSWNFTSTGAHYIRTSVSGFGNYSSSDSEELAVFTGFYKPLIPSQLVGYSNWLTGPNDALARANAVSLYAFSVPQHSKELLQSNLTGIGVLLSGEFIVLGTGQDTETLDDERTVTSVDYIPGTRLLRDRQYAAIQVPEQVTTDWFGFILQNHGDSNYTASVKVLRGDDETRLITQLDDNKTTFMNASTSTRENAWYKVAAKIFESETSAELYNATGTLLQNITVSGDALGADESGVLVTYDEDAVLVFKNLKAETLNQPAPSPAGDESTVDKFEQLSLCVGLTLLLAVAVAAVTYMKERKRLTFTQPLSS
jgi:hypothetical protein